MTPDLVSVRMNGAHFALVPRDIANGYVDMMRRCEKAGPQWVGDLAQMPDAKKAFCAKQTWSVG